MHIHVLLLVGISTLLHIYPGVEWLGHRIEVCVVLVGWWF